MPPTPFELAVHRRAVRETMMVTIQAGRRQHPKATFPESEAAIDVRLAVWRVRLIQDVALASQASPTFTHSPRCLGSRHFWPGYASQLLYRCHGQEAAHIPV